MTTNFLNFFKSIILIVWLALGLYYGISGYLAIDVNSNLKAVNELRGDTTSVVIEDTKYKSPRQYSLIKDKEQIANTFPYLQGIPDNLCVVLAALSFGVLGSITLLFKELAFDTNVSIANSRIFSIPLLGMLSGLFILGLTYLIPTIFVSGDNAVRPEVLVFLSLFAGLFCGQFYEWLNGSFIRIFPTSGSRPTTPADPPAKAGAEAGSDTSQTDASTQNPKP
jgi:hypothetical protein